MKGRPASASSASARIAVVALLAALLGGGTAAAAEDGPSSEANATTATKEAKAEPSTAEEELCELIETAATEHDIPVAFFTRLIWKESRFRADAVSPKGAQGIAQFMPGTAAERGLADPFDTGLAIPASASLLSDLAARFGNLGLAAAAYNAGADRVAEWLADAATLPWETQDYVMSITGVPAETWTEPGDADAVRAGKDGDEDCLAITALLKVPGDALSAGIETATAPWGVQVAGNFSRARAIAAYGALQKRYPALLAGRAPMIVSGRARGRGARSLYRVRVPAETRQEGERFCDRLRAAGASCVVFKT